MEVLPRYSNTLTTIMAGLGKKVAAYPDYDPAIASIIFQVRSLVLLPRLLNLGAPRLDNYTVSVPVHDGSTLIPSLLLKFRNWTS